MLLLLLLFLGLAILYLTVNKCKRNRSVSFFAGELGSQCSGSCDSGQCASLCCVNGRCSAPELCFGRPSPSAEQCPNIGGRAAPPQAGGTNQQPVNMQQSGSCNKSCDSSQCPSLCCVNGKCSDAKVCFGGPTPSQAQCPNIPYTPNVANLAAYIASSAAASMTTTTTTPAVKKGVRRYKRKTGKRAAPGTGKKQEGEECKAYSTECRPGLSCQWRGGEGSVGGDTALDFAANVVGEIARQGKNEYMCAPKKAPGAPCVYHDECPHGHACTMIDFGFGIGGAGGAFGSTGQMYYCLA